MNSDSRRVDWSKLRREVDLPAIVMQDVCGGCGRYLQSCLIAN